MRVIFVDDGVERESMSQMQGDPPKTLRVPVFSHIELPKYHGDSGIRFGERTYSLREIRGGAAVYE